MPTNQRLQSRLFILCSVKLSALFLLQLACIEPSFLSYINNHSLLNMTTISNQNSLIDPLARTKGGCATNSTDHTVTTANEHTEDDYDGMMPLLGMEEDEEIASVEADGTGEEQLDHGDGGSGESVEKKILTAALVTSMAETSHAASRKDTGADSMKRRRPGGTLDTSLDHASHVTPTTSEASSFSSVDTMGDTCNSIPQLRGTNQSLSPKAAPNPVGSSKIAASPLRTIYPRASKEAATSKVAAALAPSKVASPRGVAKRKVDAGETHVPECIKNTIVHNSIVF